MACFEGYVMLCFDTGSNKVRRFQNAVSAGSLAGCHRFARPRTASVVKATKPKDASCVFT